MSLVRALEYAEEGRPVLALYRVIDGRCTCGDDKCKNQGKHPLRSTHGVYSASIDPDRVRSLFVSDPMMNVGLAVPSEHRVLDIDPKNGGHVVLRSLVEKHGKLPMTPTQRTGSGGRHYWFRVPVGAYLTKLVSPTSGVEFLGNGRQVVVDDSVHLSGRRYEWVVPLSEPIAMAPRWLLDLASPPSYAPVVSLRDMRSTGDVMKRARAYLAKCEPAISGSDGHTTTFIVAQKLVRGFGLDEEHAFWLMAREYNPRCQPPWSVRELRRKVQQASGSGRMDHGALLGARR